MGLPAEKYKLYSLPDRFTGDAHGTLLHPDGSRGSATLAQRTDKWKERRVDLADIPYVTSQLAGEPNVYLSQQRFYGWRRISALAQLGSCYLDLDFHKTSRFEDARPEYVAACALVRCEEQAIPEPWIFATGRGILLLWPIEPTNRRALPRWNAVQRHLASAFSGFAVDKGALDAARVFRLVGSVNTRARSPYGDTVRLLHQPSTDRWDFDDLAFEVLPFSREELDQKRQQRAEVASLSAERAARKADGSWINQPAKRLTVESLWETRLADLQRLKAVRWFGDPEPGERNEWLFLSAVAMSWLAPKAVMNRELNALRQECRGFWTDSEFRSCVSSVVSRTQKAMQGGFVDYRGEQVDPRYRFKTATIIERLQITEQEMREGGLRALITPDIKREHHAEGERNRRRAAGAVDRKTYEAVAFERTQWILKLREKGWTHKAIASELGISVNASKLAVSRASRR